MPAYRLYANPAQKNFNLRDELMASIILQSGAFSTKIILRNRRQKMKRCNSAKTSQTPLKRLGFSILCGVHWRKWDLSIATTGLAKHAVRRNCLVSSSTYEGSLYHFYLAFSLLILTLISPHLSPISLVNSYLEASGVPYTHIFTSLYYEVSTLPSPDQLLACHSQLTPTFCFSYLQNVASFKVRFAHPLCIPFNKERVQRELITSVPLLITNSC